MGENKGGLPLYFPHRNKKNGDNNMNSATKKMFYEKPYEFEFTSKVKSIEKNEIKTGKETAIKYEIILEETLFYPEGGGQIADIGELNGIGVEYVYEKEISDANSNPDNTESQGTIIYHRLSCANDPGFKAGDTVTGKICREARIQNTNDHTGQHILSESFIRTSNLHTVSMHMGADFMTIDLKMENLPKNFKLEKEIIEKAEDMANSIISQNLAVKTFFVKKEELSNYKLRKMPDLKDQFVRIIDIGGFDVSLCCGTHVSKTGDIGLIKVIGQEKVAAGTRIKFVCGKKAFDDYRQKNYIITEIAEAMSIKPIDLKKSVDKMTEENRQLQKQKNDLFDKYYQAVSAKLAAGEMLENGIYYEVIEDYNYQEVSRIGQIFSKSTGNFTFLLIKPEDNNGVKTFRFVTGKTAQNQTDIKALFAKLTEKYQIKGGGSPVLMQGGLVEMSKLPEFKEFFIKNL